MKKPEVKPIPLEQVTLSEYNVRKENPEVDIDDLKESIFKHGLLQPIVVFWKDDHFECVIGQRRLLAHCKLRDEGRLKPATILANIVDEMDAAEARTLSIVENLQRAKLTGNDEHDAYKYLLKRYSSLKAMAKALGQTNFKKIFGAIGYDEEVIPSELRTLVEDGDLTREEACELTLRNWPGTERTVLFAKALVKDKKKGQLDPFETDRVIKNSNKEKELPPEQVIKKFKKAGKSIRLGFHLTGNYADGITTLAKTKNPVAKTVREITKSASSAAKEIVESELRETGYAKD